MFFEKWIQSKYRAVTKYFVTNHLTPTEIRNRCETLRSFRQCRNGLLNSNVVDLGPWTFGCRLIHDSWLSFFKGIIILSLSFVQAKINCLTLQHCFAHVSWDVRVLRLSGVQRHFHGTQTRTSSSRALPHCTSSVHQIDWSCATRSRSFYTFT